MYWVLFSLLIAFPSYAVPCGELVTTETGDFAERVTSIPVYWRYMSLLNAEAITCLEIRDVRQGDYIRVTAQAQVTSNSFYTAGVGSVLWAGESCDIADRVKEINEATVSNVSKSLGHHLPLKEAGAFHAPADYNTLYIGHFVYSGSSAVVPSLTVDRDYAAMFVEQCR